MVYCLAFSPDAKTLASGGTDKAVTLWDVASGEKKKTLKDVSNQAVAWIQFSPDSHTFVTCGVGMQVPVIWDATSGKQVAKLEGHSKVVYASAFNPDGKTVVTVSADSTVRFWDAATGKEKDTLRAHDGEVKCLAFSPDGAFLATGGEDKTVTVWNLRTANVVKPVLEGHLQGVMVVSYTPDGRILSRSSGGGLFLWKHPANKPTEIQKDIPYGQFQVRVWNEYFYSTNVAVAPDGKTLAVGNGNDVHVQDLSKFIDVPK
jgi:WD40 repeat protein